MLLALNINDERILATRKESGFCPECGTELISRMGSLNVHHWSHKSNSVCKYGEGKGLWHLKLQMHAYELGANIEVRMKNDNDILHVADIVYGNRVIELQHTNISVQEILERTRFFCDKKYRVDWVIDYRKNNFESVSNECVVANGYHKKAFDCLYDGFYGRPVFDLGCGCFFIANVLYTREVWDSNEWRASCQIKYVYIGYTVSDIITRRRLNE